jgi:hypothetical protein
VRARGKHHLTANLRAHRTRLDSVTERQIPVKRDATFRASPAETVKTPLRRPVSAHLKVGTLSTPTLGPIVREGIPPAGAIQALDRTRLHVAQRLWAASTTVTRRAARLSSSPDLRRLEPIICSPWALLGRGGALLGRIRVPTGVHTLGARNLCSGSTAVKLAERRSSGQRRAQPTICFIPMPTRVRMARRVQDCASVHRRVHGRGR